MDLVINPLAVAAAAHQGGRQPQFTPGQIVEAVVLALLKDGAVRLSIADTVLDVRSELSLAPGTTLRFAVKAAPDGGVRLVPIPGSVRPPAEAPITVRPSTQPPSISSSNATATPPREAGGTSMSVRPANAPSAEPVLRVDLSTAGARAPAVAESMSAATSRALASVGLPIDKPYPPAQSHSANTAPAPAREARLPSPAVTSGSPPAARPTSDTQQASANPSQALALAVRSAAARQGGLAPLFANVEQLLKTPLPKEVLAAAGGLLRTRLRTDAPVDATAIKTAVKRSGLFLEQQIASAQVPRADTPDLKLALLVLRHALRTWIASPEATSAPGDSAAVDGHAIPLAPSGHIPKAPPPIPYRGVPTTPQAAAVPTLAEGIDASEAAEHLLTQTEGALARQTLLQAASLPDRPEQARSDALNQRWLFEVPLASPQGTCIAQFEIGREGGRAGGHDGVKVVWRARFSVDVEPIGPVHAQIALVGERAAVTLWAERDGSATQLREASSALAESLKRAELETSEIQVWQGSPKPPQPEHAASGRFLDCAS